MKYYLAVFFSVAYSAYSFSFQSKKIYDITRTDKKVKVDGELNEPAWDKTSFYEDYFVVLSPDNGAQSKSKVAFSIMVARAIKNSMALLGIRVPDRM